MKDGFYWFQLNDEDKPTIVQVQKFFIGGPFEVEDVSFIGTNMSCCVESANGRGRFVSVEPLEIPRAENG